MNLSSLEKSKERLKQTIFKDYLDRVDVTLGLKCLVVCIADKQWEGDLPAYFDEIPVTYLFECKRTF